MIVMASDHGGVELKDFLAEVLRSKDIDLQDLGTYDHKPVDYPDFANAVARTVAWFRGAAPLQ